MRSYDLPHRPDVNWETVVKFARNLLVIHVDAALLRASEDRVKIVCRPHQAHAYQLIILQLKVFAIIISDYCHLALENLVLISFDARGNYLLLAVKNGQCPAIRGDFHFPLLPFNGVVGKDEPIL